MGSKPPKTEASPCALLSLAAELRLEIYRHVIPDNFLPTTPQKNYEGLYLSCKQIKNELDYETLRIAPGYTHDLIQSSACVEQPPMNVLPLGPQHISSLLRITIEIPRSTLDSPETQIESLRAILPVLALHLSTVTINIVEAFNKTKTPMTLEPRRKSARIAQKSGDTTEKWWSVREADRYREQTTFATVNGFVSAINCLVAPDLCRHSLHRIHSRGNFFCVRPAPSHTHPALLPQGQAPPPVNNVPVLPSTTVNTRKIVVQIKELHKEGSCPFCDMLPHIHYHHSEDTSQRWTPGKENTQLHLFGWHAAEMDKHGTVLDLVADGHPAKFIWTQQPVPAKMKSAKVKFLKECMNSH